MPHAAAASYLLVPVSLFLAQSDLVPVGEDQRQHLELARDIAERTNYLFGGKKAKKMGCKHTRLFKCVAACSSSRGSRAGLHVNCRWKGGPGCSHLCRSLPADPSPLPARLSACRVPEALIPPAGARVMSLQDGVSKKSKSAESDLSRVNLLDPPDLIVQKVKVGVPATCTPLHCFDTDAIPSLQCQAACWLPLPGLALT